MRTNFLRVSSRQNLSRKCRKIVKFLSITHSERNIWNCPTVATAILQEKRAAAANIFCTWPSRSPDLRVCDFFLWSFRQGQCLRPATPKDTTRIARVH
jgi:hypothetical protein